MKKEWIITFSGTNSDGAIVQIVFGTYKEVQEYLIQMIKEDVDNDKESFDTGTTEIKDLVVGIGYIFGYTVFNDYHIDYQAVLKDNVETITLC